MRLNTTMVIIGAILIVLALLIAIIPQFTNCQSEGKSVITQSGKSIPMKCYYTARSEIIPGILLLVIGVLLIISGNRQTSLYLSILGVVAGVFVILMPVYLIGVCSSITMVCNAVMKPILLLLGSFAILDNIASIVLSVKEKG